MGGKEDFDLSSTHLLYTAKDPSLSGPLHSRQNVRPPLLLLLSYLTLEQIYILPLSGTAKPRQLTTGKQGSTSSPVLSKQGDKAAWLEQRKDGHSEDRCVLVLLEIIGRC